MKYQYSDREDQTMRENCMYIKFPAIPENEKLARMIAAAFLTNMNPTLEEMEDVKTAVSEAVTNCIIHADDPEVEMNLERKGQIFSVMVTDHGKGIEDVKRAMEPLYTTKSEEERSGMGFAFMEAFMNEVKVESELGKGTRIKMMKKIGK